MIFQWSENLAEKTSEIFHSKPSFISYCERNPAVNRWFIPLKNRLYQPWRICWKTTASATEPELQPVAKPAAFASVENGGDIDVPFFLRVDVQHGSRNRSSHSAAATQPLSHSAILAERLTQPLSHSATQPLWVTEWLSGWRAIGV